jgi:hypothetical protein
MYPHLELNKIFDHNIIRKNYIGALEFDAHFPFIRIFGNDKKDHIENILAVNDADHRKTYRIGIKSDLTYIIDINHPLNDAEAKIID